METGLRSTADTGLGWREGMTTETAWGNFWGHGIALHSDYGGGSINMDGSSIHELIYVQKLIELYVFLNSQV